MPHDCAKHSRPSSANRKAATIAQEHGWPLPRPTGTKNQRLDWFCKTARQIPVDYADVCVEDLDLDAIRQRWGRKASDYAYAEFLQILAYQMEQTGSSHRPKPVPAAGM